MAYLPTDDPRLNEDILKRKEFYQLKPVKQKEFPDDLASRFDLTSHLESGSFLQLQNYQTFVKNFISPQTPYSRLLINHATGSGKTILALSIAMEFIQQFKLQSTSGEEDIGSIFIIGFTEKIFKDELLKFPEFGFISRSEIQKWNLLKSNIISGSKSDIERLNEFQTMIKKRISNRKGNGYFKFYGYKQLLNRLFILSQSDIVISDLSHDQIDDAIERGDISYNMDILKQFKNSIMICDEIHNTYNSLVLNNWGYGLKTILRYHPSLRTVFMSATPLNNSPTEIIDLLNLLVPVAYLPNGELYKDDLFDGKNLKPNAADVIRKVITGRISFLRDINPKYFPSRCIIGEKIKSIDYLKFIRSPMSPFHYKTYKNSFTGTLSQDSQYLVDFVIPDPTVENPFSVNGLFKTTETKKKLTAASSEWKRKMGVDFINGSITGDFLHKSTLGKYSAKYKHLINDIHVIITKQLGKIFIFHNVVHMSGVLFIQQVLLKNGIIDETGLATDSTLCAKCGITKGKHAKKDHSFSPARFVIVHADIDKTSIHTSIEKFNKPHNAEGHEYMILLGSRVIKEAHNISAVQNTMVTGRPDNISTLIQIIGRTVRKYSHVNLLLEKRHVNISIYTTCLPIKHKGEYVLSYEEIKYREKIEDYKIIEIIMKILHESAVDAIINRDIITLKSLSKRSCTYNLDILPFEPVLFKTMGKYKTGKTKRYKACKNFTLSELNLSTFTVYHNQKEINMIILIIKRMFIEISPIWKFNDLWEAIIQFKSPYEINTTLFEIANFIIALNMLVHSSESDYIEPYVLFDQDIDNLFSLQHIERMIDRIFDPTYKRILMPSKQEGVIKQIGEYYILFPIDNVGNPIVNIEIPFRGFHKQKQIHVNIQSYLDSSTTQFDYINRRQRFYNKYKDVSIDNMKTAICDYGPEFHICLVEECISCIFINLVFPYRKRPTMYNFYFKMLYYYDMMNIIIWGNTAKEYIINLYKKYTIDTSAPVDKVNDKSDKSEVIDTAEKIGREAILNLLQSTIDKTSCIDCSAQAIEQYNVSLKENEKLAKIYKVGTKSKEDVIVPVALNKLPIGHYLKFIPRFFHPIRLWFDTPEYFKSKIKWIENDIIIGFEKKQGMKTRFMIRNPKQKMKHFEDIRMMETGSECASKPKKYLENIARALKIQLPDSINVVVLCKKINTQLLMLELVERKKGSNVKYFYFYFELQKT